jgi:hypothetical protein
MHDWIDFLLLGKAALAADTIIARIALALLAARRRAASRAHQPSRLQAAHANAPALGSDRMSRSIDLALQLGQIGIAALTVLESLHHAGLL